MCIYDHVRIHECTLGNPIANDPCYGGDMYYNDYARKQEAIKCLEYMKSNYIETTFKTSHLRHSLGAYYDRSSIGKKNEEIPNEVSDSFPTTSTDDAQPKVYLDVFCVCFISKRCMNEHFLVDVAMLLYYRTFWSKIVKLAHTPNIQFYRIHSSNYCTVMVSRSFFYHRLPYFGCIVT